MATRKARTDGEQDDGWPKRLDHAGALERIMQRSDGSLKGLDQDNVEPAWFGRSSCRLRCRGCLSIWQQDGIGEQLEGAAIEEHRR